MTKNISILQLYFVSLDESEKVFSHFLGELDGEEIQKAQGFHFEKDRKQFVLLRGVLKYLIGQLLDINKYCISITYNKYGKPLLKSLFPSKNLYFNVSHSQGYGLIALSLENEVGVDLEKIDFSRQWEKILAKNFSEKENQYVFSVQDDKERIRRFFQLWTLKEAIIKCEGKGLFHSLEEIHLPVENFSSNQVYKYKDFSFIHLSCPKLDYSAALAVKGKIDSVNTCEISPRDLIS